MVFMNKAQRYFVLFSLIATAASLALFVPWKYLGVAIMPLPANIQTQLHASLDAGLDGVILYVDTADKAPQRLALGWHNRAQRQPARVDALFRIASISKLYVATVVVKLVHRGELSLDRTVVSYLPDIGEYIQDADKITLRMLLQHRSGIANYSDHPQYPWFSSDVSSAQKLSLLAGQPLLFAPNSQYQYSNSNFLLIGEIILAATHMTYEQHIKSLILSPLALSNTFVASDGIDDERVMSGYHSGVTEDLKALRHLGPSGSITASAEDVARFVRALNTGDLLTPPEQALYGALYPFEHTGLLPGYSSIVRYLSDIDTVIVLFVSNSGGDTWALVETTFQRIARIIRTQHTNRQ